MMTHDDVLKWKHIPRYWPFFSEILPVTSEFPSQRLVTRGFAVFIWAWTNDWVNNGDAGDLKCHRAHYNVVLWCLNG